MKVWRAGAKFGGSKGTSLISSKFRELGLKTLKIGLPDICESFVCFSQTECSSTMNVKHRASVYHRILPGFFSKFISDFCLDHYFCHWIISRVLFPATHFCKFIYLRTTSIHISPTVFRTNVALSARFLLSVRLTTVNSTCSILSASRLRNMHLHFPLQLFEKLRLNVTRPRPRILMW